MLEAQELIEELELNELPTLTEHDLEQLAVNWLQAEETEERSPSDVPMLTAGAEIPVPHAPETLHEAYLKVQLPGLDQPRPLELDGLPDSFTRWWCSGLVVKQEFKGSFEAYPLRLYTKQSFEKGDFIGLCSGTWLTKHYLEQNEAAHGKDTTGAIGISTNKFLRVHDANDATFKNKTGGVRFFDKLVCIPSNELINKGESSLTRPSLNAIHLPQCVLPSILTQSNCEYRELLVPDPSREGAHRYSYGLFATKHIECTAGELQELIVHSNSSAKRSRSKSSNASSSSSTGQIPLPKEPANKAWGDKMTKRKRWDRESDALPDGLTTAENMRFVGIQALEVLHMSGQTETMPSDPIGPLCDLVFSVVANGPLKNEMQQNGYISLDVQLGPPPERNAEPADAAMPPEDATEFVDEMLVGAGRAI